jgi:hypothetical protein
LESWSSPRRRSCRLERLSRCPSRSPRGRGRLPPGLWSPRSSGVAENCRYPYRSCRSRGQRPRSKRWRSRPGRESCVMTCKFLLAPGADAAPVEPCLPSHENRRVAQARTHRVRDSALRERNGAERTQRDVRQSAERACRQVPPRPSAQHAILRRVRAR